jgi:PadR family transcriptional regulator, regulatory protein PadR
MAEAIGQLRKGLAELSVLAVIEREEAYGYQIIQRLAQIEGLGLTESTVYPILARLAAARLVSVRSVESSSGPPRRYYRLTESGCKRYQLLAGQWKTIRDSLNLMLEGDRL